ncbi:MAG: non-canonical purine pyrophosphatase, RdgB/HAM1 family [Ignavibacteria bacterium]|nr:non-canonical purine pyrophosphatase, RdgB/HAM1 family [Ignavibacteria bacterium]
MKILIGTNNQHKIREIRQIFHEFNLDAIELLTPAEILESPLEIEENGATLEENALLKARAFFEPSKITSIADDTGLEIDALDGKPGVHSARFAGIELGTGDWGLGIGNPSPDPCPPPPVPGANDASNRKKVLKLMENVPPESRQACFRTVICLVDDEKKMYFEGICEGKIITEERGSSGFGYDPIFVPDGFTRTFAEMIAEEKNSISHRGRAIRALAEYLSGNNV